MKITKKANTASGFYHHLPPTSVKSDVGAPISFSSQLALLGEAWQAIKVVVRNHPSNSRSTCSLTPKFFSDNSAFHCPPPPSPFCTALKRILGSIKSKVHTLKVRNFRPAEFGQKSKVYPVSAVHSYHLVASGLSRFNPPPVLKSFFIHTSNPLAYMPAGLVRIYSPSKSTCSGSPTPRSQGTALASFCSLLTASVTLNPRTHTHHY